MPSSARPPAVVIACAVVAAAFALGGCENPLKKKKEEEEVGKNVIACKLEGDRLLLRFDSGEVRLLLPSGDRVFLYQVPSASGIRYTNGSLELRGKGNDLPARPRRHADGADRVRAVRPAGAAQVASQAGVRLPPPGAGPASHPLPTARPARGAMPPLTFLRAAARRYR